MARPRAVEPEELRRMVADGLTNAEIGQEVGLTSSGVKQALRKAGIRRNLDHKWAAPWVVRGVHQGGAPHRYLRQMSRFVQGRQVDEYDLTTAIHWAQRLVEEGLDVDYSPDMGDDYYTTGGFYHRTADPDDWIVKKVLTRTLAKKQTRRK